MALVAELQFTQGATVGPGGEAFIATLGGGAVTSANVNNALALSWTYQLLDVPIGSSLSTSTPYSSGSSPTGNFTPDVAGAYQVMLTVNGVGNTLATDVRTVLVETANRGWIMPAYEDTNLTLNYPNPSVPNAVGWKDSLNKIFADLDAHGFFTDVSHGATSGQALAWSGTAWVPTTIAGGGAPGGDLGGASIGAATVFKATGSAGVFALATTAAAITWAAATGAPTIKQADNTTNSSFGQSLVIQAQNATGTASPGGNLVLQSGTGTSAAGSLVFKLGATIVAQASQSGTDFDAFGLNPASAGFIRAANNTSVVTARNAANTQNIPLLGTDASNNVQIGDSAGAQGALTVLNGTTGVNFTIAGTNQLLLTANSLLWQSGATTPKLGIAATGSASGTSHTFSGQNALTTGGDAIIEGGTGATSGGNVYLKTGVAQALQVKISDGGIGWVQFDINQSWVVNAYNITLAGAGGVALNGGGVAGVTITAAKFTTKIGLNRAVRRTATSTTLTTSDDILIFSATAQTATLPTSPAVGDKYTVGLDAASTANTYSITGPASSIIVQGSAVTTLPATTNATSFQAYTLTWTGSFWLACPGY